MKRLVSLLIVSILLISLVSLAVASKDVGEKPVKVKFIHYKDGKIKPDSPPGKPTTKENCYKLLGAQWQTLPVSYSINPANPYGMSEKFVTSAIYSSVETWDANTKKELFNNAYTIDYSANWDDTIVDYKNEYSFGSYPDVNVIAITNIWYLPSTKEIIEYDVLFNNYFTWGDATQNPGVMDLQNIATHETGHGVGMGDLYNSCTLETMYGYSNYGDTIKRTLNKGDIAGLRAIYGR